MDSWLPTTVLIHEDRFVSAQETSQHSFEKNLFPLLNKVILLLMMLGVLPLGISARAVMMLWTSKESFLKM